MKHQDKAFKESCKLLISRRLFLGKRLQIHNRTKILQNKYYNAREDSDRVKNDWNSVEINRLMLTAFNSPARAFQISRESQIKTIRSAKRLDKLIENLYWFGGCSGIDVLYWINKTNKQDEGLFWKSTFPVDTQPLKEKLIWSGTLQRTKKLRS